MTQAVSQHHANSGTNRVVDSLRPQKVETQKWILLRGQAKSILGQDEANLIVARACFPTSRVYQDSKVQKWTKKK